MTSNLPTPDDIKATLIAIASSGSLDPHQSFSQTLLVKQKKAELTVKGSSSFAIHVVRFVLEEHFVEVLGEAIRDLKGDAKEDFFIENNYLGPYSIIYFLYMRRELGLSVAKIAEITGYVPRTIRRKRNEGFNHLAFDITQKELILRQVEKSKPFKPKKLLQGRLN